MLPFHKGDRIATTAGGATLLGFSATVKGSMVDAPEAPRRKGGHLPYAQFVTNSGRFGATRYAALFPELYEAVTERPAWLDAKSDGPMADALRPLREASQDEDGEDR